ncbi:cation/H(+) symporter 13 [Ricinus communis]|uniref:Monovalent cation:proton antiporter, putative n=1 Tax=Ricinus communis TaxID=3988 RepID=B9RIX8_RICCO|nr:cation/H(+) symporter 13 [Ricinus communis]EEF48644.1 monovalent cation:proton antiporter, putative [Ricinus communis]|eukprot:XP_002513697.3 cation/H(+) symporter 13 [Ricinus communis]
MENYNRVIVSTGTVSGPFFKESIVCQYQNMIEPLGGIMNGENPLEYTFPVLLVQISIIFLSNRFIYFLLKPLRQSLLNAQILTGILLGPSFLWYYFPAMKNLFPSGGRVILNVAADLGAILHLFTLALQIDTSIIRQARATEALLAVTGVLFPLTIGWIAFNSLIHARMLDDTIVQAIPPVLVVNCLSSFPVITGLLSDLKILNSELGRFASKISMINDMSCFFISQVIAVRQAYVHESADMAMKYIVCFTILLVLIVYIIRPFLLRMTSYAKHGQPMEDTHFFLIIISVLICSFGSELLGQHYFFGPFVLGAVLPDGPPLGTEIEHKLHIFCRGLLLPVFVAIGGLNMDVLAIRDGNTHSAVKVIFAVTYIAKFTGVVLPAICCGVQFLDALCLALILCSKGIIEVAIYGIWLDAKVLDAPSFNILLTSLLIVSCFSRPIIFYLYDPSKRYKTSNRRTIRGSNYQTQLRILICIHNPDDVPTILSLLKAFNPTRDSLITVFVLQLMQLTGRAAAILVPHNEINTLKSTRNCSLHIFNAFERLEQHCKGSILVQHFTAVAPYKSMHTDICTIALDKRTTIVIIPYHKRWSFDGTIASTDSSIRAVNHTVMEMAPCSVGLLIDRGQIGGNRFVSSEYSMYRIAMFFFGGDDDGEALAISERIASHPNVSFTVVLFKHDLYNNEEKERTIDYWIENLPSEDCKDKLQVKEVIVKNGEETIKEICSLGDAFDLAIVGRHQDPHSPCTMGLTEWSEGPELGAIGDMLSSTDFGFSVLVVAQQPLMAAGPCELKSLNSSKSLNSIASSSNLSKDDEWKPIVNYI